MRWTYDTGAPDGRANLEWPRNPDATIVIRPCRVEECAAVLALWERAGAIPSPTDTLEELQRLVRTHGDGFLVAIQGNAHRRQRDRGLGRLAGQHLSPGGRAGGEAARAGAAARAVRRRSS